MDQNEYLTIPQIAAETGLSPRRVYELVRGYWTRAHYRGEGRVWHDPLLPSVKEGREYRVKRADLSRLEDRPRRGGWRGGLRKDREIDNG